MSCSNQTTERCDGKEEKAQATFVMFITALYSTMTNLKDCIADFIYGFPASTAIVATISRFALMTILGAVYHNKGE